MNTKTIVAVALGAVTYFILGFLIYGLLLMDFMEANTTEYAGLMKDESQMMIGYVFGSILFAMLLTYILQKTSARNARNGMITGGIVSLLMGANIDLVFYFGMNMHTPAFVITDIIAYAVMGSLTGGVIGWSLARGMARAKTGATVA